MKYMGSKSAYLAGGLGGVLLREAAGKQRFVDLFAGAGAVACFVAEALPVQSLSVDLQEYSRVLANAVLGRDVALQSDALFSEWSSSAKSARRQIDPDGLASGRLDSDFAAAVVERDRRLAAGVSGGFIARDYGGHYFSLEQAVVLDSFFTSLPESGNVRDVMLAALLRCASRCAASPGHTAQPFQPTDMLLPHIRSAWSRDVAAVIEEEFARLCLRAAKRLGAAYVKSAEDFVSDVTDRDLVFCDPPYSSVQYSRFYHVLEGIAIGGWPEVAGAGRAPSLELRARSRFSMKSAAPEAMRGLLGDLRQRECEVVVTFPDAAASNGLSAQAIVEMATDDWFVEVSYFEASHSTLGGSSRDDIGRGGRRQVKEALLVLRPR